MVSSQGCDRLLPRRFADMLDAPEVVFIAERNTLSTNSANANLLPDGDVQHQFPDAVRGGKRSGGCCLRINSIQDFDQRWAVPGLAIEGAIELVNDELDLRHEKSLAKLARVGRTFLSNAFDFAFGSCLNPERWQESPAT